MVEGLRATRTTLRTRLLDMQREIVVRGNEVRRLGAAVAEANDTSAELEAGVGEAEAQVAKLHSRIGNLQTSLADAESEARDVWLARRGECQCDELRLAGGSAAAVARCMRQCADAVVVAGAALLELSRPSAATATPTALFRFAATRSTAAEDSVELHATALVDARTLSLQLMQLDAAAQVVEASMLAPPSRPSRVTGRLPRFAALSPADDGDSPQHGDTAASAAAKLASLHLSALATRVHSLQLSLADAEARLDASLTHEDAPPAAHVAELAAAVSAELRAADAESVVAAATRRRAHPPTAAAATAAAATLPRFRDVAAGRVAVDPLAAVTNSKAADLQARCNLLEADLTAKQSATADAETRRQLLVSQLDELDRKKTAVASDVRNAQMTLRGGAALIPDPLSQLIMTRRDLLRASLEQFRAQAAEVQDRTVLMTEALAAADAAAARLEADVKSLRALRDGLREQVATLDRSLASLQFNAQARRREADAAADDLQRTTENDARVPRRLEERMAELQRDETALDSVRSLVCILRCAGLAPLASTPPLPHPPKPLQYLTFMLDTNSKLTVQVAALRSRKDDLLSTEAALTAEIALTDGKVASLTAQRAELTDAIGALAAHIVDLRHNTTDAAAALLATDAERGRLSNALGDTTLARDKLRIDHVREKEEVEAARRQLLTMLRKLNDLNGTVRWYWWGVGGCRYCLSFTPPHPRKHTHECRSRRRTRRRPPRRR